MKAKVTVSDIKNFVKALRSDPGRNGWVMTNSHYCNLCANYGGTSIWSN